MSHKGKSKTKKRERFAMKHPEGRKKFAREKRRIKLEKQKLKRSQKQLK